MSFTDCDQSQKNSAVVIFKITAVFYCIFRKKGKRKMKKILSIFLAFAIILSILPISVGAAELSFNGNKIHLEFEDTPIYNSVYIEGIANIYEFDCGELSGWMYKVNGWFPNYGCSRYQLKAGDKIEWVYTCDLGNDIGGGYTLKGKQL